MAVPYADVDAVLLDMDGVLVEVADSYRSAIIETAKAFGKVVTMDDIGAAKAKGGANNDWVLTRRLILGDEAAKDPASAPSLDDVTKEFERLYQGTADKPGLKTLEQPLVPQALLKQLMERTKGQVCVVTGRPRSDCQEAMARFGWDRIIPAEHCVCMEDGPPKPDPFPINRALEILGKRAGGPPAPARCVMVGDTVDDLLAARAAGVRAVGVLTPGAAYAVPAAGGKGGKPGARAVLEGAGAEVVLMPGLAGLPALLDGGAAGAGGGKGAIFASEGSGDVGAAMRELLGGAGEAASGAGDGGAAGGGGGGGVAPLLGGPTGDPERAMAALRVRAKAIAGVPPAPPAWVARAGLPAREGRCGRRTKETSISAWVRLDGSGWAAVSTGIGFLDHMLGAMAKHGRMDVQLLCRGDLWIDDHHTAEDCALALGEAMDRALGARKDIARWGSAMCPLDEALSRAVVDVSSRPFARVALDLKRDSVGGVSCEMLEHVLESLLTAARLTAHVDVLRGSNDHHKAEASFKAVGVALRTAFRRDEGAGVPSTKGVLA